MFYSPEKTQQQLTVSSSQISVKTELSDVNLSMTTDTSPTVSPVATGTKTQPTQQTVNTPRPDQTKVPIASMLYPPMYPIAGSYPYAYFPVGEEVVATSPYGSLPRVARR